MPFLTLQSEIYQQQLALADSSSRYIMIGTHDATTVANRIEGVRYNIVQRLFLRRQ